MDPIDPDRFNKSPCLFDKQSAYILALLGRLTDPKHTFTSPEPAHCRHVSEAHDLLQASSKPHSHEPRAHCRHVSQVHDLLQEVYSLILDVLYTRHQPPLSARASSLCPPIRPIYLCLQLRLSPDAYSGCHLTHAHAGTCPMPELSPKTFKCRHPNASLYTGSQQPHTSPRRRPTASHVLTQAHSSP